MNKYLKIAIIFFLAFVLTCLFVSFFEEKPKKKKEHVDIAGKQQNKLFTNQVYFEDTGRLVNNSLFRKKK